MTAWLVVLACAAVAFVLRSAVVLGLGQRELPEIVRNSGPYVMPAMMSALAASMLVPDGSGVPDGGLTVVALVGGIAAVRTRSVAATLVAGLLAHGILMATPV